MLGVMAHVVCCCGRLFECLRHRRVYLDCCHQESTGLDAAKAVASGVSLCRDLVNSPPNMLTPGALADAAAKIAEDHGLECEILEVR